MKYFITTIALALLAGSAPASERGYLQLDGNTEATTIVSGPDLADKSFTIELWLRRDQMDRHEWIFGQGAAANNNGLVLGFTPDGRFTFAFWNNNLDYNAQATYPSPAGLWFHYACVFDYDPGTGRGTRSIFLNGDDEPIVQETEIFP